MKLCRFEPQSLASVELSRYASSLPSETEIHLWILREQALIGFEKRRSALRAILSHYTHIPPELLHFEELKDGKPVLAPDQNSHGIQFNLSHTAGIQLIALSCAGELGVDVEKIRPRERMSAFMDRYFFPSERQSVEAQAPEAQLRAFFEIWTAKEAWAKARGKSVFRAFSEYEVRTEDPAMISIDLGPDFVAQLSIHR